MEPWKEINYENFCSIRENYHIYFRGEYLGIVTDNKRYEGQEHICSMFVSNRSLVDVGEKKNFKFEYNRRDGKLHVFKNWAKVGEEVWWFPTWGLNYKSPSKGGRKNKSRKNRKSKHRRTKNKRRSKRI